MSHDKQRKIGILTGGGDCPGLNAVIRGFVHRMKRHHKIEVIGLEDSFNGLILKPERIHHLNLQSVSGILEKGGTIIGTTNRGNPFQFPTKQEDGSILLVDKTQILKDALEKHEIEGLVCIGGDGTLGIAHRLMEECNIPVIGIPKTIDNDVESTDYTFGFWTAVQRATDAIDMLHSTAESHDRIMIIELMGRDAGFISLAAGIAGGADCILLPEIPYDINKVVEKIKRRRRYGRSFSIIVVAEGAFEKGASTHTMDVDEDEQKGRMARLAGAGQRVSQLLEKHTEMETRVTVLGHLQRGGSPIAFDRVLSTTFGVQAADAAAAGKWGSMIALKTPGIVTLPLKEAIEDLRRVKEGDTWLNTARGVGICLGD